MRVQMDSVRAIVHPQKKHTNMLKFPDLSKYVKVRLWCTHTHGNMLSYRKLVETPTQQHHQIVRPYRMICCWQHVSRNTICKFVWKLFDSDCGRQCETKRSKQQLTYTQCARDTTNVFCKWRGACFCHAFTASTGCKPMR